MAPGKTAPPPKAARFEAKRLELGSSIRGDGSQWIIEGVKNGQYRIEDRWSPGAGPIHEMGIAMAIDLARLKVLKEEIY